MVLCPVSNTLSSVPTRFSSCQCWSELLQLLQSDIKLRTSILTPYSPDCPSVYRHSSETGYPPSLCSLYWTLSETPTPGFTTCSLQVSTPHSSTYSPLVILSPSCPVTSLSSVAELPVTLLSVHSPCFSVSPLSTFLGCRSPV